MNSTLFAQGLLDAPIGFAAAGLLGLLFGLFLEQAGFGSSRRLTGIFYFRDMAVLKVMFTAVVTALVGYQYLAAFGWLDPAGQYGLATYWGAQAVGGLIFGVGFVIGGWCPGTALVGVASARWDALVFLVGVLLGSVAFNEAYAAVAPLYNGACAGTVFLGELLHVPPRGVVFLLSAAAVAAFALSTRLETMVGGVAPPAEAARRRHRRAAVLLIVSAAGALFLPSAKPGPAAAAADADGAGQTPAALASPQTLLAAVEGGEDHVEPPEVAARLMAGGPDLTVVDVRDPADFARFHLRGAVNIPLPALAAAAAAGDVPRRGIVVLYSNGTTHAAQAWLLLRQAGWGNVRVMTDGILAFWRECLTPPSLAGALDARAAREAAADWRKRRAFFLEGAAAPALAFTPAALVAPGLAQHLVSTDWLEAHLAAPDVRVLDVRAKGTDYTQGHVPGAVYLPVENLRSTIGGSPNMLMEAADLAAVFGRLGLRPTDTVVVYSDNLRDATLAGMALQRAGHRAFAILHGGFQAWSDEKRVVTKAFPRVTPVTYTPAAGADTFTVAADDVRRALGDGRTVVLDVRPADYFAGEKSDEARAGHIPGAVNREFKLDLVPGKEVWQSSEVLREAYAKLGIREDTPVIVHCRTGHQASQTYMLLRHVLGLRNVRWFDGSWSQWAARDELPIETGAGR